MGAFYCFQWLGFSCCTCTKYFAPKTHCWIFSKQFSQKSAISGMATPAKTMVLWAHTRDQNCFQRFNENSFHAPREKGRVARAPTSATVKTNSLQTLQGQKHKEKKEQTASTQAVQNSKAGQTRQRKDSSESTECFSKRRQPTKLGAKPKNRPELRRVSAKGNCSGSAIADIYISHGKKLEPQNSPDATKAHQGTVAKK